MTNAHPALNESNSGTITQSPVPVVGIGPGNPAYLTTRALDIIKTSDVLVGFESVIEYIDEFTTADLLKCSYQTEHTSLSAFAAALNEGQHGAAVLMGDPNVSGQQFIEKIESAIDRQIVIIPGISSIQIAASRS